MDRIEAFAPATVANLGPGFDVLGLALADRGDRVVARRAPGPLRIAAIHGADLPLAIDANTAGVAAREVVRQVGLDPATVGIELTLHKGLPIGSGLGSSAASAAAGAVAVNALLGAPLSVSALVEPCVRAEAVVSGRHADNVAPALLGGLVLVEPREPFAWTRVPLPEGGLLVVVTPRFELPTRAARAALPTSIPLQDAIRQAAALGALIAAGFRNDLDAFAAAMTDAIATPARLPLIPGGPAVLAAARTAGALATGICGAGPSIFALVSTDAARVGAAMCAAFEAAGLAARVHVSALDAPGATVR